MTRTIIATVIGSLITAGIVAVFAYVFVIKENQMRIANVEKAILEIKHSSKNTTTSVQDLKLFVAQAHPDADLRLIQSVRKLRGLDPNEAIVLRGYFASVERASDILDHVQAAPEQVKTIMKTHDITEKEMAAYSATAASIKQNSEAAAYRAWGWSTPIQQIFFAPEQPEGGGNNDNDAQFDYPSESGNAGEGAKPQIYQPELEKSGSIPPADQQ